VVENWPEDEFETALWVPLDSNATPVGMTIHAAM